MTGPLDRDRLAKVLALLGSDQQGERDAAVLALVRILAAAGMRPVDLVVPILPAPSEGALAAARIDGWNQGYKRASDELQAARGRAKHLEGRVEELEAELEVYRPVLDFAAEVDRLSRPGGPLYRNRALQLAARTGRLTAEHRATIRRAAALNPRPDGRDAA